MPAGALSADEAQQALNGVQALQARIDGIANLVTA
jgi:hypothetical protein